MSFTMRAEEDRIARIIRCLKKVPCVGILMGLLAGAFSASGGFIVKLIPSIHPVEVVVWR